MKATKSILYRLQSHSVILKTMKATTATLKATEAKTLWLPLGDASSIPFNTCHDLHPPCWWSTPPHKPRCPCLLYVTVCGIDRTVGSLVGRYCRGSLLKATRLTQSLINYKLPGGRCGSLLILMTSREVGLARSVPQMTNPMSHNAA